MFAISAVLALSAPVASAATCGATLKQLTFDRHPVGTPYVEALAKADFAPYSYIDGWFNDTSTKGDNNRRAWIVADDRDGSALRLTYPKGCTVSSCATQAKMRLSRAVEEATFQFKLKFGPGFDWVLGGKLPGLCGGLCQTGCKEVTGLDGWSSRHMWRPLRWPHNPSQPTYFGPEGKLTAYVYHANKVHWCGDDFPFANERYARTLPDGTKWDKYSTPKDQWITITNHVRMNTAGPAGGDAAHVADGVLRVWVDGVPVVDKRDMLWRKYTNVSIDTLYFSTFFGGSSPKFEASKDEVALFDDVVVKEGDCLAELLPGGKLPEAPPAPPAARPPPRGRAPPSPRAPPAPRPPPARPVAADEGLEVTPNLDGFYSGAAPGVPISVTLTAWSQSAAGGCAKYRLKNTLGSTCVPAATGRTDGRVLAFRKVGGRFTSKYNSPSLIKAHGLRVLRPGASDVLVVCFGALLRSELRPMTVGDVELMTNLEAVCL